MNVCSCSDFFFIHLHLFCHPLCMGFNTKPMNALFQFRREALSALSEICEPEMRLFHLLMFALIFSVMSFAFIGQQLI